MLTIKQYVRPQTLDEAYALCQKRTNTVLGGMLWLKMQGRTVNTAIDLCDLGLDQIEEEETCYRIGAMVSLRSLETHQGLNQLTNGALRDALKHIVGVQFRNCATIGGSLFGRFGFSDVLTLFQVLDARVVFHHAGELTIGQLADLPRGTRDILTHVVIPRKPMQCAYLSQRNTATDFPVLAVAVSCMDGVWQCAVGARPEKAVVVRDTEHLLDDGITAESAARFGSFAADAVSFSSNVRASGEYRKKICSVLVRRALLACKED